jgi:hypothetical protein
MTGGAQRRRAAVWQCARDLRTFAKRGGFEIVGVYKGEGLRCQDRPYRAQEGDGQDDRLGDAWRAAGFRPVGHIVFRKRYASSVRFLRYEHEAAYLLAKGDVRPPATPIPDVLDWSYTGNRFHPAQKPVEVLKPPRM